MATDPGAGSPPLHHPVRYRTKPTTPHPPAKTNGMFKALGGLGNMASMLGVVQQLPEKIKQLNDQMQRETVSATSDCGKVTMTMSCTGVVQNVQIDPELSGTDLESAVTSASNNTGSAAKSRFAEAAGQMAKDMNIEVPGVEDMIKNLAGRA